MKQLEAEGYKLFRENMGSKAAARASENWLMLQALKKGMKFTERGKRFVDDGMTLLNKSWGTNWLRRDAAAMSYFAEFGKSIHVDKLLHWIKF